MEYMENLTEYVEKQASLCQQHDVIDKDTMEEMREIVKLVHERGLQNQIKVMIGGAPISQSFCDEIGADFYGEDAGAAAREAVKILKVQKAS